MVLAMDYAGCVARDMKPIWIVDDDESIRWVLEKALARENLATRSFSNVRDAVAALDSATPQVLVSDIRMPGESGLELLQIIKARNPGLPVIVMTALSFREAEDVVRAGADGFLTKPFAPEEVVARVDHLFALRMQKTEG